MEDFTSTQPASANNKRLRFRIGYFDCVQG